MYNPIYWLNGKFFPKNKTVVPVTDLSITRGFGAFDFLRTYHGVPFMLDDHLKRLENSAAGLDLVLPYSLKQIKSAIKTTLKKNKKYIPEANIKIVLTGGESNDGFMPKGKSSLAILISPVEAYPQSHFKNGVKVITQKFERDIPQVKYINYINAILAVRQAHKVNAIDVVYINRQNHILESTRSNIFIFHNNILMTPKTGILYGITRKVVLTIAAKNFKILQKNISLNNLYSADEVFLTSSNKEVMPVVNIDSKKIKGGRVGENTKKIIDLFRKFTYQYSQTYSW